MKHGFYGRHFVRVNIDPDGCLRVCDGRVQVRVAPEAFMSMSMEGSLSAMSPRGENAITLSELQKRYFKPLITSIGFGIMQ